MGGKNWEKGFTFPHFLLQEAGRVTSSGLPGPAPFPGMPRREGEGLGRREGSQRGVSLFHILNRLGEKGQK